MPDVWSETETHRSRSCHTRIALLELHPRLQGSSRGGGVENHLQNKTPVLCCGWRVRRESACATLAIFRTLPSMVKSQCRRTLAEPSGMGCSGKSNERSH